MCDACGLFQIRKEVPREKFFSSYLWVSGTSETDLISVIGDANPRKQGLLCPGVRIPVVSPADVMAQAPDYIMIGAWNFKDEMIRFFREKMGYRSRFIVPLPMPTVEE